MWLRGIPFELLCWNSGSGSGGDSGTSGDGTGGGDGSGTGGGTGEGDKGKEGSGAGDGTGDGKPTGKTYTDDDVQRMLKEKADQWARGQQKRDEESKRKAEEATLAEKEEFKTLADVRGTRVTELEGKVNELEPQVKALTERAEKAEAVLAKALEAQKTGLSKPLLDLLGRMSPTEQAEWLADNADAVKQDATTAVPNHGTGGAGNTNGGAATNAGQAWLAQKYGARDGKK